MFIVNIVLSLDGTKITEILVVGIRRHFTKEGTSNFDIRG
jgi:hypothetical protein